MRAFTFCCDTSIVVQNLIFSFQTSLALRQRLNRVQEADLPASADVKLVVHSDSHFIAVRCVEGAWQVNFTNRTHKWQEAVLTRHAEDKRSFWKKGNVWMINLSTVSLFQIVPLGELGSEEALDCAGGMFRALGNGGLEQQLDAPRSDNVEFVSACTGAHICNLLIPADSAVISLKQQVAMKLQHLPFSVVLVAEGAVLALGSTWSGCFTEVGVVLTPRTQRLAQDLAEAIQLQNHDLVIQLLELGQEPNCYGFVQSTRRLEPVLLIAAGQGYFYSTHLLLEAWADPNLAGNDRRTALHLAVCARSPTTVETLLWHGADVHAQDWNGEMPLHFAALNEDVPIVKQLLLAGADPLAPDAVLDTALLWAYAADTRAALMDGCWRNMSFSTLFLLNWQALSDHAGCHNLKQLCRSLCHMARVHRTSDAIGGGVYHAVVHSAMSGAEITDIQPEMEGAFVCKVREEISRILNVPFFSIAVLSDTGLVPEQLTWSDLGCPRCVSIVSKQVTRHLTEDVFEAVEAGDAQGVRALLLDGQDPTCIVVESALNIAVVRGHQEIVDVLLRGGAAVNLIPPGVPHAALHHAVIHGGVRICQQLLQAKADPSLPDRRGCRPIHYALSGIATSASTKIAEELLCWGADPLHRDVDDDTGFSMAVPGSLTALCLSSCWNRLAWIDVFQRHIELIVEYGWAPALVCTCASMQKQVPLISRLILKERSASTSSDLSGGSSDCKRRKLQQGPIEHNRLVALEQRDLRRGGAILAPVTTKLSVMDSISLRAHNLQHMLPPLLNAGYVQRSRMPEKPKSWPTPAPGVIDHLQHIHPHARDAHLSFEARSHTYFWDGKRVSISTTGLIHKFSHRFDPAEAIAKMRTGGNWPRAHYLKTYIPIGVWLSLQELGYAHELLRMLSASRRPNDAISKHVQDLIRKHPEDKQVLQSISLDDSQIKLQWAHRAEEGASRGTWMHASFECLLNGGFIATNDDELKLCLLFLQRVAELGARVFRTEWTIYATEEDLAGSIDLAMQLPDQSLILVDWKRTQQLSQKGCGFGRRMAGCLATLSDATLWQYRLQLNIYRFILQKYYDCKVSQMFIVGCHPDNGAGPYVEDVQLLLQETDALMATVRRSREEEGDQFGGSGHNPFLPACFFGASLVGWAPKLPADLLLLQYLFRHPGSTHPHTTERIRAQLAEFYRAINPYSDTLAKFPALFWILPVPFEILESRVNWCYKLEVARIFFCLIKDGLSPQLECAMITFFWPEIQEDPSLLEVVSTSRTSFSRRDRIKRQVSALLCLNVLSSPFQRGSQQTVSVLHRYVALFVALKMHPWSGRPSKAKAAQERVLGIGGVQDILQSRFVEKDLKGGASSPSCSTDSLFEALGIPPVTLSSTSSSPSSSGLLECTPALLSLDTVNERIRWLEALCCDYKVLLAATPEIWYIVPSPFSCQSDTTWHATADEVCCEFAERLHRMHFDAGSTSVCRVDKRLRVYVGILRTFTKELIRSPQTLASAPNPCDALVSKRMWEEAMWSIRKKLRSLSADRLGGASQDDLDFEARVASEFADSSAAAPPATAPEAAAASVPELAATQAKEEQPDDDDQNRDPVLGEDASETTWRTLRKRRLLPGALTSDEDFGNFFEALNISNDQFQAQPGEAVENPDTILHIVRKHESDIKSKYPRFSSHMVRLSTAALAIFCMRTADMSIREHALMLWILEGTDYLRFHEGDCYMLHPCGAFQRYRGVPADSGRVTNFLLQLEGLFRRLPEDLPREPEQLLEAIRGQWEAAGEDEAALAQRCLRAALSNVGESLLRQRGGGEELNDVDSDVKHWRYHAARVVLQLKVRLARELTEDKLLHYMVEWCETPKKSAPACCFEDCCIEYGNDGDGVAHQVARAEIANVYVRIPHQLKGTVPEAIAERLQKFYRQTFWCNIKVFQCCQAAQALAKRGYNVTRIFIGLSSGGVGQSLFSAHLQAGLM